MTVGLCAQSFPCPTLCNPMDYSLPDSVAFPKPEYWNGLPCPPLGDPNPGIKPALQADSLPTQQPGGPRSRLR